MERDTAIKNGTDSIKDIKRGKKEGMDLSQRRACSRLKAGMITEETGKKL